MRLTQAALTASSRRGPSCPTAGMLAACERAGCAVLRCSSEGDDCCSAAWFCTASTTQYADSVWLQDP